MRFSGQFALVLLACVSTVWLKAAPGRADVTVTVYNGNPAGAGNGSPFLDFSNLTQVDSFGYYGPAFGIESQAGGGNPSGDWRPFYKDTNYSARVLGQISVAQSGAYTFSTRSDDGSVLKIDGNVVVNNNFFQGPTTRTGTVTLPAGIHNVEIQYFQGGGGKSLDVGSANSVNMLPAGVTWVDHGSPLRVSVYAGQNRFDPNTGALVNPGTPLIGTFMAPDINFDYATGSRWSPFGRTVDYSVDITGLLNVPANGMYNFGLNSDDGSFLYIDGVQIVNDGGFHGSNDGVNTRGTPQVQNQLLLTAGLHEFEVRMFQGGGGAGLTLFSPVPYAAPVPEPTTVTLAAVCMAGCFVAYRWRRPKRKIQNSR